MTTKQKRKGTGFENQVVETLNSELKRSHWKRIPGSGAIGTIMGESFLTGDISGEIYGFPLMFKGECKAGYSNKKDTAAKSLALEKEWLDKIKKEAEAAYRMPIFFGKFDNVRTGVKMFVAFDMETFVKLSAYITKLKEELDKYHDLSENK